MAFLLAPPASAQDFKPSIYMGVHGGKSFTKSDIDDAGVFALSGLGGDGYVGGVHAGVDFPIARASGLTPFAGIFGGYDWQNTQFNARMGSTSVSSTLGNSWYTGARLGLVDAKGAKYYILAAYRQTDLDLAIGELLDQKLKGWDLGIGTSFVLAKNINLGVEGIWTKYDRQEFATAVSGPCGGGCGVYQKTDALSVMARLNFEFGSAQQVFADDPEPASGDPKLSAPKKR